MLLVELIKQYAGQHKTDRSILNYLETETEVAHFDPYIDMERVTDEWLIRFRRHAGTVHARRIRKAIEFIKAKNKNA